MIEFPLRRSAQMMADDPKGAREAFHAAAESTAPLCPSCQKPVRHRKGVDWCYDDKMSEHTLQDRIRDRAKRKGWEIVHIGKAVPAFDATGKPVWITSAPAGWPDLLLFKPGATPAMAWELKKQTGVVTEDQERWLTLLNACGIPAIVVRPSDLREGRVSAMLAL